MEPTQEQLFKAYNSTNLNRVGYTFDKAMNCSLIKKCLIRIAINHQKQPSEVFKAPPVQILPPAVDHDHWWKHGQYE